MDDELGTTDETPALVAALGPDTDRKKSGRRKISIEYIDDKNRRQITFSKRKAGLMKKAYELTTLTGTQALLLVASETGHVYTFATPKLQPFVTLPEGKNLIQSCLSAPDSDIEQNIILDTSLAVWTTQLIAGRVLPKPPDFNKTHLRNLQDIAKKWSRELEMDIVCAVSGPETADSSQMEIVFGIKLVEVTAHQGPSLPLSIETLRLVVYKASQLPLEMWREVADRLESLEFYADNWRREALRSELLQQKDMLYHVSSGPSPVGSGNLVFGVLGDAPENYNEGKQVVMGIPISDGPYCSRIATDEHSHEERLEQTKDLEGSKGYYLIAQTFNH